MSMILLLPDLVLSLSTQAVHANLSPEVELETRTLILALEAGCAGSNLVTKHMARLVMIKMVEDRVRLKNTMLRHVTLAGCE